MSHVPVSEAKAQLTDLVRRVEAGEDVVLTRHGRDVVRLVAVAAKPRHTPEERRAIIHQVQKSARAKLPVGLDAARSQDFLYGDDGLPA